MIEETSSQVMSKYVLLNARVLTSGLIRFIFCPHSNESSQRPCLGLDYRLRAQRILLENCWVILTKEHCSSEGSSEFLARPNFKKKSLYMLALNFVLHLSQNIDPMIGLRHSVFFCWFLVNICYVTYEKSTFNAWYISLDGWKLCLWVFSTKELKMTLIFIYFFWIIKDL